MFAEHNVLASSMQGFIALPEESPYLILSYGTVLFQCSQTDLKFLEERLQLERTSPYSRVCPCTKAFLFRLPDQGAVQLYVSRREIAELHNLICEALLFLHAQDVIRSAQ